MITKSKLQTLSEDCSKLLSYSEKLETDDCKVVNESNRVIKQALRKIVIANEIADRMIICITGLQGTGKTTLMKNFYDLDDDIMNIALGRGERLPVFITEHSDVNSPEMYAVGIEKINTEYSSMRKKVPQSEFVEMSKAEDDDTTIMYLEILVPRKYLAQGVKLSYMLLPGYEGKNDYWQTLIDFSVKCSDTAVFVLEPSSISDFDNAKLMDRIKGEFGDNVIYVITHSDDGKTYDNEENKNTLIKMVGMGENDGNRIICTGSYTDFHKNMIWKEQLRKAIENYSANPASLEQRNFEYIKKIIRKELQPATFKIKKYANDVTAELMTEFKHSTWLDAFDKSATNMRAQYEKALTEKFQKAQGCDEEELRNILDKKPTLQQWRRSFFGENLKDIGKARQIIDDAMKDKSGYYRYKDAFSAAIAECIDSLCTRRMNQINEDELPVIDVGTNELFPVFAAKDSSNLQSIVRDINTILSNNAKKEKLVAKNPVDTMRAIVECGTQFFGLVTINELYSEQHIAIPAFTKSSLTQKEIKDSIRSTKNFILTILGLTAADLVVDNQIDFVPILAANLGVSVPIAGGITAVIIGVGAARALIEDYNRMQLEDYYSYNKAILSVYDKMKKVYLDRFDDYIKELRSKVERYLIDCEGDNEKVIHKQNAKIAICNIQMDLDDIYEGMKNNEYELTKLIRW